MITQDLLDYIKNELAKGTSRDVIQSNLISGGWDLKDVAEGFSALTPKAPSPAPASIPSVAPVNTNANIQTPVQPIIQVQPSVQPATPIEQTKPITLHIQEETQSQIQPTAQPIISAKNIQPATSFQPVQPAQSATPNTSKITPIMNYHIDVKQKKSGSPFGIIILILLVLGGGAYAYYKYLSANIPSNNIQNQPAEISTTTQNRSVSNAPMIPATTTQNLNTATTSSSTSLK